MDIAVCLCNKAPDIMHIVNMQKSTRMRGSVYGNDYVSSVCHMYPLAY